MSFFFALLLTLAQNPNPAPNPLQQAGAQMQQGNFAQAVAILEPVVEAQPQNATAWYWLGYAYHAQKDWSKAVPAHEMAASFPATAANASYNLACAWALQGDADKAFEWLGHAKTAGFQGWAQLWSDTDLASIQNDPRFANYAPPAADFDHPFVEETEILFAWHGENANDQFGWVAVDAGDIDGDGTHDVITSAPFQTDPSAPKVVVGCVYLFSGKTGKEIRRHQGTPQDGLGMAVAGMGDLDDDGFADYAATAPRTNDTKRSGGVLVWSGKTGELLFEITGAVAGDGFGREVDAIFDVNADGTDDIAVGSSSFGAGRGRVTIHSGKNGALLHTLDGAGAADNFGTTVSAGGSGENQLLVIGAMNAGAQQLGEVVVYRFDAKQKSFREAFRAEGGKNNVNYGRFFSSVIGDVNADGIDDVYTVDFEANTGGPGSGQVRLLSGADGKTLWIRDGLAGEGLGIGNAIAGDINQDGHADVITGAWQNSAAAPSGGRCYLLSGKDGSVLRMWTCTIAGATMGFDSTSLPDCNQDGARDFLFTAAWTPVRGTNTGSVYLVSGAMSE
ncbi:MAG: hypothetical protein COA70_01145 [Planctomycetota bacterium]|nr:MAG: hypothetical protein COA70_01145 [Planctomycetota bacterium]